MTVIADRHDARGATYVDVGGVNAVAEYGAPTDEHVAVRNAVGITEVPYGVVVVEGADRVSFVDNVVSNRVPDEDGTGVYALLLDPTGRIESDMYVYNAGERLLLFTPPSEAATIAESWTEHVFIDDVTITDASDEFAVFGVHGPAASDTVNRVLATPGPSRRLTFTRGAIRDVGVTVIATDAPTGEAGYEVVCRAGDAGAVFDAFVDASTRPTPFGYRAWESLTLEAGTPLFATELRNRLPNFVGVRNAIDFDKGCFVGQEFVSRVENRGTVRRKLVGLRPASLPDAGAELRSGDDSVGAVTRAVHSPTLDEPVAFAMLDTEAKHPVTVQVDGGLVETDVVSPPLFVEGSGLSARLPQY